MDEAWVIRLRFFHDSPEKLEGRDVHRNRVPVTPVKFKVFKVATGLNHFFRQGSNLGLSLKKESNRLVLNVRVIGVKRVLGIICTCICIKPGWKKSVHGLQIYLPPQTVL